LKRLITLAACAALPVALLLGCTPQKPTQTAAAGPGPKYNIDALPMPEYMGHVVDPAAFAYWKGSGTEETSQGVKDLSPKTEEGWEELESAAAALIEVGNALQIPGRERPGNWYKFAQQLTAEAILAKAAAEKHDKNGAYDEGAKLYLICTACHKEYVIDPGIKANGPATGDPLPDWPADVKAKQQKFESKPAG